MLRMWEMKWLQECGAVINQQSATSEHPHLCRIFSACLLKIRIQTPVLENLLQMLLEAPNMAAAILQSLLRDDRCQQNARSPTELNKDGAGVSGTCG